jgi:hypothetical protein
MKTGILMVEKDGIPVAGQMIKINRNIGQLVNVGILNGEETYIQSGILTYIVHHTILWFHGQGIRKVILGQSLAVFSDGPFQFKQKWEPRVTRPFEMIQPIWKFLMNDLPADLIEKINQMGIITEKKGKYYYLEICPEDELCNAENALPGTRRRVIQSLTGSSIVWRNNQNYQPY